MPFQPRTAKEAAPAVLRVAPPQMPAPRARAGADYSKVGRAIWMLQVSTGRWDPSTPIPFSRSSPHPSGNEPDASELEIPDEAAASADVRNPPDEFTAPHISQQGELSFAPRPGSAEQLIPESPNDWMRNRRFPDLASPDQLPSTPLTDALRILGRSGSNARTDDSPVPHSSPDDILDSRAIQSAISATPFGPATAPASPSADPGLDRFFKPSPLGSSDFAGREVTDPSIHDLVMRVPPGVDPAGPMPNWLTGAMPIPNFNPETDPIHVVQVAQHDDPTPPAGSTRSTMPLDSRTAQEQELRFDAYFRAKKAALPFTSSPSSSVTGPAGWNLWDVPPEDSPSFSPVAGLPDPATDRDASRPIDAGGGSGSVTADGALIQPSVEFPREFDKLTEMVRSAAAGAHPEFLDLIRAELSRRNVGRAAQRYGA